MNHTYKYDFVLSFSGADRGVVEKVRHYLLAHELRIFYDFDEQHDLLGRDLAEHFAELYQEAGQYCVVFISQSYLERVWCKWERRAALARAISSKDEYIIPYVLQDVAVPGIPQTIGHARADVTPPWAFASLLVRKLKSRLGGSEYLQSTGFESQLARALTSTRPPPPSIGRVSRVPSLASTYDYDKPKRHLHSRALYGIASRPGMGKTAIALAMATRLCQRGIPVAFLTVDQPVGTIVRRLLALTAKVDLDTLRGPKLEPSQLSRVAAASDKLSALPLRIVDAGDDASLDVALCELWTAISSFDIRLFFVDSLSSINSANAFNHSGMRGSLSALKAFAWLAQETSTTGLISLSLTRSVEMRNDKTPVATDVTGGSRTSSLLEEVFMLYRGDYYDPTGRGREVELDVFTASPARGGVRRGPMKLVFDRPTASFAELWDHDLEADISGTPDSTEGHQQ